MTKAFRVNALLGLEELSACHTLLFRYGNCNTSRLLDQVSQALAKNKMEREGLESFRPEQQSR
jgi:hypothetical protein